MKTTLGNTGSMSNNRGFTLIEVMIAVVIIGILASIAYPSYSEYVSKTRRELAKHALVEAGQRLERYYAQNLSFSGAVSGAILTIYNPSGDFGQFYTLSTTVTANSYNLSAAPKGAQSNDDCGTFTINSSNQTSASTAGCW